MRVKFQRYSKRPNPFLGRGGKGGSVFTAPASAPIFHVDKEHPVLKYETPTAAITWPHSTRLPLPLLLLLSSYKLNYPRSKSGSKKGLKGEECGAKIGVR